MRKKQPINEKRNSYIGIKFQKISCSIKRNLCKADFRGIKTSVRTGIYSTIQLDIGIFLPSRADKQSVAALCYTQIVIMEGIKMTYKGKKITFKKTKENTYDAFHGNKFIGCVRDTIDGIKFYAINGKIYRGATKTIAAVDYVINYE